MSTGFRVGDSGSVCASVQKTIQNIREIAGNHSDDDIYAMLKECNMDPNETTQKLLLQDTFHEVKRKRVKKKENVSKEPNAHRWRAGTQGRAGRAVRGGLSSRYASHDAASGPNASKENGITQAVDKEASVASSSCTLHNSESCLKSSVSSPISEISNGSENLVPEFFPHVQSAQACEMMSSSFLEGQVDNKTIGIQEPLQSVLERHSDSTVSTRSGHDPVKNLSSRTLPYFSGGYSSSSDHVLYPLHGERVSGMDDAIKRKVGSHPIKDAVPFSPKLSSPNLSDEKPNNKLDSSDETESKKLLSVTEVPALEAGNTSPRGAEASKPQGVEINLLQEAQSDPVSSQSDSVINRSSSYYNSRILPLSGPQKAIGSSKEWKPKLIIPSSAQLSRSQSTSTSRAARIEVTSHVLASQSIVSEESTSKVEKKLEELHLLDGQHVIIPNRLQVSDTERCNLSFGSFGANFELSGLSSELDGRKASAPLSDSFQGAEKNAVERSEILTKNSLANEREYLDAPQSASHVMENLPSTDDNVSPNAPEGLEPDQSKMDAGLAPGGHHHSMIQTAPHYSTLGLIQPIPGNQFPPLESNQSQSGNDSHLPSFVVQQPFDPATSCYTPLYQPGTDGDARFPQVIVPGSGATFNGNIAVLSSQSAPPMQEGGNSLVLSSTGASPVGVVPSAVPIHQQPLTMFRQPVGMHLSHYTPNYLPYNHYFPSLYAPPPSIHHFLSNTAFAQPSAGLVYPPPTGGPATPVKYSLSQYKPGTNAGSAPNVAMPTGYATYTSSLCGFSPAPVTTGNSSANDDVDGSQFKENNVYIAGQQSEGSGVWLPTPGRDAASMPTNLFYNLPPAAQLTFGPSQAGHGAFAGTFHPAHTMGGAAVHPLIQQSQAIGPPIEIVGPQPAVYQQTQRAQVNWASNY